MSQHPRVDPRGLRFGAAITSGVLAISLVVPVKAAEILLVLQTLVFAAGAFGSLQRAPYGLLFAKVVRPRIGAPAETEDAAAPRFAQLVGFVFLVVALIGFFSGLTVLGYIATAFALIAALLNAATGFCLGCEFFLAFRRLAPARAA